MLSEELTNARFVPAGSVVEWCRSPERITGEVLAFVDSVWESAGAEPAQLG
jgi:hypothetical protein